MQIVLYCRAMPTKVIAFCRRMSHECFNHSLSVQSWMHIFWKCATTTPCLDAVLSCICIASAWFDIVAKNVLKLKCATSDKYFDISDCYVTWQLSSHDEHVRHFRDIGWVFHCANDNARQTATSQMAVVEPATMRLLLPQSNTVLSNNIIDGWKRSIGMAPWREKNALNCVSPVECAPRLLLVWCWKPQKAISNANCHSPKHLAQTTKKCA